MRRFLIVLLGSFGLVTWSACGQAPPAEPMEQNPAPAATSADPKEQFAGTWKLVRVERYGPDGDLLPPPEPPTFGSDGRVGFIMYDSTGHMGVVTQQAGRQPYAGERRTPEEALAAITSYGSYFGPYTVNEAEGYVIHHVKGSVNPGGVGHCQVDGKLVDQPPRYWAPARREPAMLGIKNGRQPQLDNTLRDVVDPMTLRWFDVAPAPGSTNATGPDRAC